MRNVWLLHDLDVDYNFFPFDRNTIWQRVSIWYNGDYNSVAIRKTEFSLFSTWQWLRERWVISWECRVWWRLCHCHGFPILPKKVSNDPGVSSLNITLIHFPTLQKLNVILRSSSNCSKARQRGVCRTLAVATLKLSHFAFRIVDHTCEPGTELVNFILF